MKHLILLLTLFLSACNSHQDYSEAKTLKIMNIIALTEANAPNGVKGVFELPIKAAGTQDTSTYLNTEQDYRDRRNITVALGLKVSRQIAEKYGIPPEDYFVNKTIEVTGEAKRVKIYFIANGRQTKKYYYQTHIRVRSLDQIKIVS